MTRVQQAVTQHDSIVMPVLLSINIPTYNRSGYLKALIESFGEDAHVLANRLEINILDNASTDDTEAVVQSLPTSLPIRYQRHDRNLGPLTNIHLAHRAGEGKYVWVVGDDDYLQAGQLRRIFDFLVDGPAALLLSYSRVTPDGHTVGHVDIGDADRRFTKDSPDFDLAEVDSLIGFLSANIIQRSWIDRFDGVAYDELDERGELAHATIFYAAIAAGEAVQYVSGQPLAQTVDNGYLRHEMWTHVCVKYCMNLPEQLIQMGFEPGSTRQFFSRRLFKECIRRTLSEKYRGNSSDRVVDEILVRQGLGWRRISLVLLNIVPASIVRLANDSMRTPRQ